MNFIIHIIINVMVSLVQQHSAMPSAHSDSLVKAGIAGTITEVMGKITSHVAFPVLNKISFVAGAVLALGAIAVCAFTPILWLGITLAGIGGVSLLFGVVTAVYKNRANSPVQSEAENIPERTESKNITGQSKVENVPEQGEIGSRLSVINKNITWIKMDLEAIEKSKQRKVSEEDKFDRDTVRTIQLERQLAILTAKKNVLEKSQAALAVIESIKPNFLDDQTFLKELVACENLIREDMLRMENCTGSNEYHLLKPSADFYCDRLPHHSSIGKCQTFRDQLEKPLQEARVALEEFYCKHSLARCEKKIFACYETLLEEIDRAKHETNSRYLASLLSEAEPVIDAENATASEENDLKFLKEVTDSVRECMRHLSEGNYGIKKCCDFLLNTTRLIDGVEEEIRTTPDKREKHPVFARLFGPKSWSSGPILQFGKSLKDLKDVCFQLLDVKNMFRTSVSGISIPMARTDEVTGD
jgi:hypothetical protein